MRKSTQAMLWSAAIFPGAGHLFLKSFARGFAFIAMSLISLSVLLFQIVLLASQIIEQRLAAGSNLDIPSLVSATLQASAKNNILTIAIWVLVLSWLLGTLDAYRLGKKLER